MRLLARLVVGAGVLDRGDGLVGEDLERADRLEPRATARCAARRRERQPSRRSSEYRGIQSSSSGRHAVVAGGQDAARRPGCVPPASRGPVPHVVRLRDPVAVVPVLGDRPRRARRGPAAPATPRRGRTWARGVKTFARGRRATAPPAGTRGSGRPRPRSTGTGRRASGCASGRWRSRGSGRASRRARGCAPRAPGSARGSSGPAARGRCGRRSSRSDASASGGVQDGRGALEHEHSRVQLEGREADADLVGRVGAPGGPRARRPPRSRRETAARSTRFSSSRLRRAQAASSPRRAWRPRRGARRAPRRRRRSTRAMAMASTGSSRAERPRRRARTGRRGRCTPKVLEMSRITSSSRFWRETSSTRRSIEERLRMTTAASTTGKNASSAPGGAVVRGRRGPRG